MSFTDKTLHCCDCDNDFTFTVEEQEQFQSRGYTNEPKRCPECRQARKAQRGNDGNDMYGRSYNSNRPSFSGGRTGYQSDRQMFPAVCSQCGKQTTVPFEPRQNRPVYCSDCFRSVKTSR